MNQPNNTKKEVLLELDDLIEDTKRSTISDTKDELAAFLSSALDRIEAETEKRMREDAEWLYNLAGESVDPYLAWSQGDDTQGWRCHGCDGEFASYWPKWEKPTLTTFPHAPTCKYVSVLTNLALLSKKEPQQEK